MSMAFGRNRQANTAKQGNSYAKRDSSPQKVNGKHEVKVMLYEITPPPVEIWLSLQCPSSPVVNDLFARLPQDKVKFSNTLKMWLFSFSVYERIVQEFTTPPFESMHVPELPKFLATGLASYQKKVNKLNKEGEQELNLSPRIVSTLLPFQLEAVKYVVKRGGRALLGDDMGCGKTFQAIACMVHFRAHWPVLIVVPSSLLKQWPDEIQKYAGDIVKPSDVCVVGKSTDIKTGLITIITYKVMDNLVANKQLSPDLFGVVVADESHNLKNKDTSRSGAVLPFLKRASVAICMTGTPAVNRPVELFSQLNGILPEVFSDYNQFVHRYCDAKPHRTLPGLNVSGSSNEAELNMLLNAVVMIRRTKADVLSSLPEKRRELRYVDPDPECLPEIRRINARSKKLDEQIANPAGRDNAEIQAMNNEKQQLLTALYTVTGTSKIPAIREELVKMIEESRKERGAVADSAPVQAADCTADSDSDCTVGLDGGPLVTVVDSDFEQPRNVKAAANKDQAKAAPIIMDLEDDIVTGGDTAVTSSKQRAYVMDLCDSDAEDRGAATANRKRPRGATGGGKLGGWDTDGGEDDDHDDDGGRAICRDSDSEGEDCDFNLRDIKAGLNRQRSKGTTRAATGESSGTGGRVFSLFEQVGAGRKRKTAGAKGKAAPKAKAAEGNVSHSSSSSDLAQTAAKSVGQKIIVFFHHKTVLSAIEDSLVQMQVKFIKIDGATPQAKRAKMIDQFQNDDVTDVALLSITACGVGLNLTRANVALFGELNWSLGVVLQAEDRIHRLGQLAKEVRIIYMIARNTVDEIVWEQIQRKHQVVGATVGTSETRSYGGGMRINSCRGENGASVAGSSSSRDRQQPTAPSAAEQEAVLAGFHAYANQATTAAPPVAAQPPQSVGGPFSATSARPVPQSYLVPPVAGGNGAGSVGCVASYGMRPPVHPGPFSAVAPFTTQPQPLALNTRPEEFAYSASTQATDAVQDAEVENLSKDIRDGFTANKPINGTSASGVPMGGGNPFAHSAVPQPFAQPAAIETPAAIEAPAAKSALAPEVLARIEANKLAAQAKLAAAKQRAAQEANSISGHQPLSTARSLPLPGTITMLPPPQHPAPAPAAVAFAAPTEKSSGVVCMASPGASNASLSTRAASINEPPMAVRPSPMKADAAAQPAAQSSTHTFSTGRGGTVHVSEEHMQRAGEHFSVTTATTAAPAGSFAPANAPPKMAAMQAATGERSATSFGGSATLFFDGGSLGNPGKGGAGYQLFADNGRTIKESAVRMNGTSTNNQAEYVGLIHGLTAALHSGVQNLTVYGDSEVVIKQMLGQYQVKNPVLIDLHQRAVVLRQQFRRVTLQWIPREKNGGADALSKKAMHQAEAASEAADWFR